jgi:hypothetical protein
VLDVQVTGVPEVNQVFDEIAHNIGNVPSRLADQMTTYMREEVHVQSGYLHSTIHSDGPYAMANAPYAGFEADRGGAHDFPALAEEKITDDTVADYVMEGVR